MRNNNTLTGIDVLIVQLLLILLGVFLWGVAWRNPVVQDVIQVLTVVSQIPFGIYWLTQLDR